MEEETWSFAEAQASHTPDRKPIPVCFDRDLLFRFEEASVGLADIKEASKGMLDKPAELAQAETHLAELQEQVRAAQKTFVFQSIGTRAWRDLLSEHPPTSEQRRVVTILGLPLEFNPDTFVPAAMAASCVVPKLTKEQADWFCETFPVKEVDRVFGAVLTCNVTGLERPFDDGARVLHGVKK